MNEAHDRISSAQAEVARQIFNGGNPQVGGTMQMIFGEVPQQLDIHTRMLPLNEVAGRFGTDPLITVHIGFSGDLRGQFLFLQQESEFARLRKALQNALGRPARTAREETDYLVPDWLQDREAQARDEGKIRDALGELGNILLGSYLTAVYSRCEQATFQELPETRIPDKKQEWLRGALRDYAESADRAFMADVSCAVHGETFRFRLLLVTDRESLLAMLGKLSEH